jgi:hypothetical protein
MTPVGISIIVAWGVALSAYSHALHDIFSAGDAPAPLVALP